MIFSPRMSQFFVAGTSTFSPSTPTVHLQHRLLHNGAPGLVWQIIFYVNFQCNFHFYDVDISPLYLLCKISVSSGHQKLFPCVPSLVHVPIPVCHLYMIRLWISSVVKLIVKETATRRATRSFPLPTLRPPSQVSTIQMLLTNSTTGTRGTIEMSTQEFATFLEYIYQHFLHNFYLFKIKAELILSCSL